MQMRLHVSYTRVIRESMTGFLLALLQLMGGLHCSKTLHLFEPVLLEEVSVSGEAAYTSLTPYLVFLFLGLLFLLLFPKIVISQHPRTSSATKIWDRERDDR